MTKKLPVLHILQYDPVPKQRLKKPQQTLQISNNSQNDELVKPQYGGIMIIYSSALVWPRFNSLM